MKPKFKLGQEIWSLGLTVRKSGSQHTQAYYLPLKHRIWKVEIQECYDYNNGSKKYIRYLYGVKRPDKYEKRTKEYKRWKITNSAWNGGHQNICEEKYISTSKKRILKICHEWNHN